MQRGKNLTRHADIIKSQNPLQFLEMQKVANAFTTVRIVIYFTSPKTSVQLPNIVHFSCSFKGIARTQSLTNKNYALDLPTFGVIADVNPTEVQWKGLTLEDRPS